MRVIAGTARSIPLVTPEGKETRPTTDKIKETLFNILQFELQGALFADLFAGSGAIGIEALSRGAAAAFFTDTSKTAIDAVSANVRKCRFTEQAMIIKGDARANTGRLRQFRKTHGEDLKMIVFLDPPYGMGLGVSLLKTLCEGEILRPGDLVILEEALKTEIELPEALPLDRIRVKEYKNQKHLFYECR